MAEEIKAYRQYIYKNGQFRKTSGGGGAEIRVVDTLPELGEPNVLYVLDDGQDPAFSIRDVKINGQSVADEYRTANLATKSEYNPETNKLVTEADLSGGTLDTLIIKTTYNELKALRDAKELIPGMKYQITDYETTTTQAETQSAGHKFDIIVEALSESELSESAKATYHYEVKKSYKFKSGITAADIRQMGSTINDTETFHYQPVGGTAWRDQGTASEIGYVKEGDAVLNLHPEYLDRPYFVNSLDSDGVETNNPVNYYYDGVLIFDGVEYDRWIEERHEAGLSDYWWLTNKVVESVGEEIVPDGYFNTGTFFTVLTSFKRGITPADVSVVYKIRSDLDNSALYDNGGGFSEVISELTYKQNENNEFIPCLLNPDPDNAGGDVYLYYDGTYVVDGVTYDSWLENVAHGYKWLTPVITETSTTPVKVLVENKIVNLNAWELKYCLDNDNTRFTWADTTNGKGVIYYMKDEWNNECYYDFKNIKYYRNHEGSEKYCYTFTWINENDIVEDLSVIGHTLKDDVGEISGCYNNYIGNYIEYSRASLSNNTFICSFSYDAGLFYGNYYNKLGVNCHNNTFGNVCKNNTFGNYCSSNTFGNSCDSNTFGNNCSSNTFGKDCDNNIFGNGCSNNAFGNYCHDNIFGNSCTQNTFGNYCFKNTFGNYCFKNILVYDSSSTTYNDHAGCNTFEDEVSHVSLLANSAYSNSELKNITISQGIRGSITSRKTITEARGLDHQVVYRAANSEDKTI